MGGRFKRPNVFAAAGSHGDGRRNALPSKGPDMQISEGGSKMRMRNALLASVCLTFVLAATAAPSLAEGAAALAGQVISNQEGPMEGVLVTANKAGSTIAITVVPNPTARYSFPASR